MKSPRKLSMRKSNGEVVESSEDDPSSSSAASSRPISRVSTTASLHSLLTDEAGDGKLFKLSPGLQAFKFYFNAFSKSLSPRISLNILKKTVKQIFTANTLYLNPAEIFLRRLRSNEFYLVKFQRKLAEEMETGTLPNLASHNEFKTVRVVQILPDPTAIPIVPVQNNFIKELSILVPKNLCGAKITHTTAFNIFGNSIFDHDSLFEVEIIVS